MGSSDRSAGGGSMAMGKLTAGRATLEDGEGGDGRSFTRGGCGNATVEERSAGRATLVQSFFDFV